MKNITNNTIHLKYKKMKMISMNNHVFKGHKALLGSKFVTYGELELESRYDIFPKSKNGFDWGDYGDSSLQLSFAILYQLSYKELAEDNYINFAKDIVSKIHTRDWILNASDILEWIKNNCEQKLKKEQDAVVIMKKLKPIRAKKTDKVKTNIVRDICKELNITQKTLAEILEVPEGTVSSWAVRNEIPRLGKKAIEFYILNAKNQKIVDSYKSFKNLLDVS